MQSVYFKEQRLKKYASLNNSRNNFHRNYTCKQGISTKTQLQNNESINLCLLQATGRTHAMNYIFILCLWGFLCIRDAGCKDNKITACLISLFVLTLIFTLYQNSWIILITFALLADWLNISTLFLFFSKQTSIESILVTKIKIIFMYNTNQSLFNYW